MVKCSKLKVKRKKRRNFPVCFLMALYVERLEKGLLDTVKVWGFFRESVIFANFAILKKKMAKMNRSQNQEADWKRK